MDAIFCDYDIGMFTLEPHDESEGGQFMKFETAKSRAAYHEAGHAVLKYALGLGLTRIFLRTTIAEDESGNASKAAVQELTKAYQELAAQNVKNLTAAMQALAAVKSPTEFMELQRRLIKEGVEAAVKDSQLIAQLTTAVFTSAFEPVRKQIEAVQKSTRT